MKILLLLAAFTILTSCKKETEAFVPKTTTIDTVAVKWFHVNINLDSSVITYTYYMELDQPLIDTAIWVSSWKTVANGQVYFHTERFKLFPGMLKQYHVSNIVYEQQNQSLPSSIINPGIDSLKCPGIVFDNKGTYYQ